MATVVYPFSLPASRDWLDTAQAVAHVNSKMEQTSNKSWNMHERRKVCGGTEASEREWLLLFESGWSNSMVKVRLAAAIRGLSELKLAGV